MILLKGSAGAGGLQHSPVGLVHAQSSAEAPKELLAPNALDSKGAAHNGS